MSAWTKEQLESMLFDVVDELNLSDSMMEKHGPFATPPAELVRMVLEQKDREIQLLKAGFVDASEPTVKRLQEEKKELVEALRELHKQSYELREHCEDLKFLDFSDDSIDGVLQFNRALEKSAELINN